MKTKTTPNAASTVTCVRPKFGPERHKQLLRQTWAAERHKLRPGTAAQQLGKRK
jgi:ribosomal protein L4